MKDRKMIPASVVVITDRYIEKVLMLERNVEPFGWCLPGGKIEEGETSIEAAIREVKEETGLDISDLTYLGPEVSITGRKIYLFHAKKYDGVIKLSREHKNYMWVNPENTDNIDLSGRTNKFLERFILYYQ